MMIVGNLMRTFSCNSMMLKQEMNQMEKTLKQELPLLMMISQVPFTSKRARMFKLMQVKIKLLFILRERMEVMVLLLLIIKLLIQMDHLILPLVVLITLMQRELLNFNMEKPINLLKFLSLRETLKSEMRVSLFNLATLPQLEQNLVKSHTWLSIL